MIGALSIAVLLAGAAPAGDARSVAVVAPAAVKDAAPIARVASPTVPASVDPGTDPDRPSAAWLARMARPCVRSGSRAVC